MLLCSCVRKYDTRVVLYKIFFHPPIMRTLQKSVALIAATAVTLLSTGSAMAATTSVSVGVSAGSVGITAPATVSFPAATASSSAQQLDISAGQFTVEDLKGATAGYYTTVSITDLTSGGNTITKSNVSINVASATVTLVAGNANAAVTVPTGAGTVGSGYVAMSSAVTLLQRTSAGGINGKYGVTPALRVNVPAYSPSGSYAATLTFTLIEN